jgi:hypothetical protein
VRKFPRLLHPVFPFPMLLGPVFPFPMLLLVAGPPQPPEPGPQLTPFPFPILLAPKLPRPILPLSAAPPICALFPLENVFGMLLTLTPPKTTPVGESAVQPTIDSVDHYND